MRVARCYDNGATIGAADLKCVDSMGLCRDQCGGPALEKSSFCCSSCNSQVRIESIDSANIGRTPSSMATVKDPFGSINIQQNHLIYDDFFIVICSLVVC
jgi:hypothetical protein